MKNVKVRPIDLVNENDLQIGNIQEINNVGSKTIQKSIISPNSEYSQETSRLKKRPPQIKTK